MRVFVEKPCGRCGGQERYETDGENKGCVGCRKNTNERWQAANPVRKQANNARWVAAWKAKAFAALGGKCAHCGFTDTRALQIDHVAGGGSRERRAQRSTGSFYRRVAETASQGLYQLLCANCNWIKYLTKPIQDNHEAQ